MSRHFDRQIDRLKRMILTLGAMVEEAVEKATDAVTRRDVALARSVIDGDAEIDLMELEVEEECLHTLALYQPVAFDLRFIVALLKINNDLERIGDLAKSIAREVEPLSKLPGARLTGETSSSAAFDLGEIQHRVKRLLCDALDALVRLDADRAEQVWRDDNEVDRLYKAMHRELASVMRAHPDQLEMLVHLEAVGRRLERIGDHAVNIAKDVLYMIRGEIQRHSGRRPSGGGAARLAGTPGPGNGGSVSPTDPTGSTPPARRSP